MKTRKIYTGGLLLAAGLILNTFSVSPQEKEMTRLEKLYGPFQHLNPDRAL